MASTPTTRRSSRINASINTVKDAVSPKIKSSVNNVTAAVSPKIRESFNRVKAAVSPSNVLESCRRVSRRVAEGRQHNINSERETAGRHDSIKSVNNPYKSTTSSDIKSDFPAAVSPSNILDTCRRVSRRVTAGKPQSKLTENNNNDELTKINDIKSESHVKLGPEEVKQQLGTCRRLDILRSRLVKINKCDSKVKSFKKEVELADTCEPSKGFAKGTKQVRRIVDNENNIIEKDPAYERYTHLVAKPEEGLVLPAKLKVLNDYFRAVDTVISLLHNRQETITFTKIQSAVQEMMKKNFSQDILAKIKTVFPDAYIYRQDKTKNLLGNFEYNLAVSPSFQYKSSETTYSKMTSADLNERKNMFFNSLILIIKTHHDKFLGSLDEPVVIKDGLKRWHPEFDLSEIPDVELSSLPQPPEVEKLDSAVDVLSRAMDIFSLGPGESKAISVQQKQETSVVPTPKVDAALKGVSSSLLEKIRAREAARASQSAMLKSKDQCKELDLLKRLPEVARILRNTFITEKKVALPWETMVNKVSATFSSSIYDREVDEHLHRLVKETPGWLTVCKVSSGTYLKINKNIDVNNIIKLLCDLIKLKQ